MKQSLRYAFINYLQVKESLEEARTVYDERRQKQNKRGIVKGDEEI